MLSFSSDPKVAERQMDALIYSLTAFGYIDGDFDASEKELVKQTIRSLVERRVDTGMPNATPDVRQDLIERFSQHFVEKFEQVDTQVGELFLEPVAKDEDRDNFVHSKLKQRCFELFEGFDGVNQQALLASVDELIAADGELHPAELEFRGQLVSLLETDADVFLFDDDITGKHTAFLPTTQIDASEDHPFFKQFEFHYSADPTKIEKQVAADLELIARFEKQLTDRKAIGEGRLKGKATMSDIEPGADFLDGWTHVLKPKPGEAYELTVLGDLHGCYSCLKAAVMQTRFFEKVEAYQADPQNQPNPKLVLLGDYIDRGIFSLNGVLRTVLQMATKAPDHVYVLRGNHEYFVEYNGQVYGGVKPAEAINSLKPHLPVDVFLRYRDLFDHLPNVLLFDHTMFVHGGIPRDRAIKERWEDLSTLNDADLRFQMMWSDPSSASVIPAALQEQSARFPFGRLQFQSFMKRIGCRVLVRGHEKINEGYERVYDDGDGLLVTVFSAGGAENRDLPAKSSYRGVTPMALTMRRDADGTASIEPFEIAWRAYNDPDRNAFHQRPPEIEHKLG